jgi:hypothetical protein
VAFESDGALQEPFFLRSAQRFFIASDSRFLPAGVIGLTRRVDLPLLWSAHEQALGVR